MSPEPPASDTKWPSTDTFSEMSTEDLREHAADVTDERERCRDGHVPHDTDVSSAIAGYACDLRLEHIEDVLRTRGEGLVPA